MKFFPLLLTIILFSACNGENPSTDNENPTEETTTAIEEDTSEELIESDEEEDRMKYVISARVGIYGEQAVFVLNAYPPDESGVSEVDGYYYYIKKVKNLDIEGQLDTYDEHFVLTEKYKDKISGYMEFDLDDPDECFWSPAADPEDEQGMSVELIDKGNPSELTVQLENFTYVDEHGILNYEGGETGFVQEEVTDKLFVTIVNEEYFLFDIHVTGQNYHQGSANGMAKITGSKAIWEVKDEFVMCRLYFDLSDKDNQITVSEEECDYYHGQNARFDATFKRKN